MRVTQMAKVMDQLDHEGMSKRLTREVKDVWPFFKERSSLKAQVALERITPSTIVQVDRSPKDVSDLKDYQGKPWLWSGRLFTQEEIQAQIIKNFDPNTVHDPEKVRHVYPCMQVAAMTMEYQQNYPARERTIDFVINILNSLAEDNQIVSAMAPLVEVSLLVPGDRETTFLPKSGGPVWDTVTGKRSEAEVKDILRLERTQLRPGEVLATSDECWPQIYRRAVGIFSFVHLFNSEAARSKYGEHTITNESVLPWQLIQ